MHDPMTGLFGLDRRIVQNKNLNANTWKIALEIAAKTGVEGYPVAYIFEKRIAGSSKASIKPALQFLIQLVQLYLWKVDLTQMLKFCVVGTSGLVVNMGLLMLMVEVFGVDYRPAAIMGIGVAMVWNYVWNKFWTFKREGHAKHSIGEGARSLGHGKAKAR
jgi:dolichol-phosphate mannosyltransferase